jgi:hypothetical protein
MTLQSSGAIKFSEIQTEFGGSNPVSASEYYAGGTNVPSGTSGVNGAVPASGTIAMSKYYGTSAVIISISNTTVEAFVVLSGTATASYRLGSDGNISEVVNGAAAVDIGDWVTPKSFAANYEVYATYTGDTPSTGTFGSWQALTSTRIWTVARPTVGESIAYVTLQIRKIGTTTILDTATITLIASKDV